MEGAATAAVAATCGLRNRGNDCFVNAVLQCLANTPGDLRAYFRDGTSERADSALAYQLRATLRGLWGNGTDTGSPGIVDPAPLRAAMAAHADQFRGEGPGDASEFLSCLLWELHMELNRGTAAAPANASQPQPQQQGWACPPAARSSAEAWSSYTRLHDSVVSRVFRGLLRTDSCCARCGRHSGEFKELLTLNVWPTKNADGRYRPTTPLLGCIDAVLGRSVPQDTTQLFCNHCDDIVTGTQVKSFVRMPRVLVVHVQMMDWQSGTVADTVLQYPHVLDLGGHRAVQVQYTAVAPIRPCRRLRQPAIIVSCGCPPHLSMHPPGSAAVAPHCSAGVAHAQL
jgi:ubiquitin C-terminal hydrolase